MNHTQIINTIKLLIYKEYSSLLEKIDFDDDEIFLEPLLFSYFNNIKDNNFTKEMLTEIMQGYFVEKEHKNVAKATTKINDNFFMTKVFLEIIKEFFVFTRIEGLIRFIDFYD